MCALGYRWYVTVKLWSIIIMDSILFVCLAVVDCWLLHVSVPVVRCTCLMSHGGWSKSSAWSLPGVMLRVCGSLLSTRVTTRSCSESSSMGGSTWATTTTRVVPAVSTLTGGAITRAWASVVMTRRGCSLVAVDDCFPVRLLMGGAVWMAAWGWPSPGNVSEKSRPCFCVEVEVEGLLQPDSLARIKKLLISDIAGDGSAKASVVDFLVGWHGIGVAIVSVALMSCGVFEFWLVR